MKRVLSTLIGLLALGATLPSFAGPDWAVIEHGRKVKLERMQKAAAAAAHAVLTSSASKASDVT